MIETFSDSGYRIGRFIAQPASSSDYHNDHDPRGILWMFEPPHNFCNYIIGTDPTYGIENWSRENRNKDDAKTDNAVACVIRKGFKGQPDVQVAEFAAPITPFEFAGVVNFIGRLYGGDNEEGQAYLCNEVWPGPGLSLHAELSTKFGYTNEYYHRYLNTAAPTVTQWPGFYANRQSVSDLWIKGRHHINKGNVRILSPWLVEEMADCSWDMQRNRGFAQQGSSRHDDRVSALLLALWAANQWTMSIAPSEQQAPEKLEQPNWQASDCSAASMLDAWNERVGSFDEE